MGDVMEALTLETFTPHLNTVFRAQSDAGTVELLLEAAVGYGPGDHPAPRASFSLTFRGPVQPIFPQQIFHLDHAVLGGLDIFLVPIGADAEGVTYEAVFA
jgi:hypothetical protein